MSLDTLLLKKLLTGDIAFFNDLDNFFKESICDSIRTSPYRLKILSASFNQFKKFHPYYAFLITFDLPEYTLFCQNFLREKPSILVNNRLFHELLECNEWMINYLDENLENICFLNFDNIFSILRYSFAHHKTSWLKKLSENSNMLIRIHTMYTIIDDFPYYFNKIYPNPLSLLTKSNNQKAPELVEESYLSKIAILTITNLNDISLYHQIKDFILTHYPYNSLASLLDSNYIINQDELMRELLIADIDELFTSSKDYKWQIYQSYKDYLSSVIRKDFEDQISPFIGIFNSEVFESMSFRNLLIKFLELAHKYLELSTKTKCIANAGSGTCSYVYRVGDYIIKYSDKKYSSESALCPNLYLIAKNYEEVIIRNDYNQVTGAIEVQKYLSKVVLPTETELLTKWQAALRKEGYYLADALVGDKVGNNCFRLDDYHEADTKDPDALPEWFKKDPVVLVDRDLIYSYKPSTNN